LAPDAIYIVDNHSEMDTAEMLLSYSFISKLPDRNALKDSVITHCVTSTAGGGIQIKYIYKCVNDGSGGGFYAGMKAAYQDGYEWLWMMDDDGLPTEDELEQLLTGADKYNLDYANALVVSTNDSYSLAFGLARAKTIGLGKETTIDDYKGVEVVRSAASPFNGTLINRRIPEKIGFIKKEMFIWGEEIEYFFRTMENGFSVGTVVKSIHYHPQRKGLRKPIIPFFKRPQVSPLAAQYSHRSSIYFRNKGYIAYKYRGKLTVCKILVGYSIYFILRFRFADCKLFIQSFINGCRNRFY
jgi:rhamnopyranosyl-N-acetylglucosaminyl-diphospho-decaprenol beta-1,3/1,4-galactofuranosyltransferase